MTLPEVDIILDKLQRALGTGAAEVTVDGQKIVYRTNDAILKAISYFQSVRASLVTTPRRNRILLNSRSGL